jgi:hypothetical protein
VGGDVMNTPLGKLMRNSLPLTEKAEAKIIENRRLRWSRLAEARKLCAGERVEHCNWTPVSFVVEVWKSRSGKPSYFRAVATCGSVWMCPVCADKITAKRQQELKQAVENAKLRKMTVYMFTYTVGHKRKDSAENVLRLMLEAVRKLKGRKFWTRIKNKLDIKGSVTNLESTFSELNGTHAHKHILEFCNVELSKKEIKQLRDDISCEYGKIVKGLGGYVDGVHDVDIVAGDDFIAEYIAKYGRDPKDKKQDHISYEMTRSATKTKSFIDGHFTAFQLLDLSADGNEWARKMFIAYRKAFRGRAQLTWSKGLRELLELDAEQTDQEIANEIESDEFNFANMLKDDWKRARLVPHVLLEASRRLDYDSFAFYMFDQYGVKIESPVIKLVSEWTGETITISK